MWVQSLENQGQCPAFRCAVWRRLFSVASGLLKGCFYFNPGNLTAVASVSTAAASSDRRLGSKCSPVRVQRKAARSGCSNQNHGLFIRHVVMRLYSMHWRFVRCEESVDVLFTWVKECQQPRHHRSGRRDRGLTGPAAASVVPLDRGMIS